MNVWKHCLVFWQTLELASIAAGMKAVDGELWLSSQGSRVYFSLEKSEDGHSPKIGNVSLANAGQILEES